MRRQLIGAVALLAVAMARPAARGDPPRVALVLDETEQAAILLDVETGATNSRLTLPPGRIFRLREPSRLIIFTRTPTGPSLATVVGTGPLRVVSTIPLDGTCKVLWFLQTEVDFRSASRLGRFDVVQSDDGRRVTVLCGELLVNIDVMSGAAATLPLPSASTTFYQLPGDKALIVARSEAASDVLLVDLAAPRVVRTTHVEGKFVLTDVGLSADGRTAIFRKDADRWVKPLGPSELVHFDIDSGSPTKTVRLSGAYHASQVSADGRYLYATNTGDIPLPKGTPRVLEIVAVSDGTVVQRLSLSKDAGWFNAQSSPSGFPSLLYDGRGSPQARLIVLDGDRMTPLPISGAKGVVVIPDPIGNRMFVLAGPSLIEYSLPLLERVRDQPLGRSLGWFNFDRFFASDDGSRIVWMADENKVRVLNTHDRVSRPEAKIGTSGAKAKTALGELLRQAGESVLRHSLGGEGVAIQAAFRTDSRQAYALASTRELATIDLDTGRVLAHRPGGSRLVSTAHLIFTVDPTRVNVIDRSTGADVQSISLEKTAPGQPVLEFSKDGTRAIVTGGTSVHFLDGRTGKTVAMASGLGHIVAARFLD